MSNPTSNFGWQMPTATDLVTDLPADFEVFGQAVDTALMDLKGGTTGQVLKKNTNADMDFVWSADSAGMTNPMTTTGDTIYSSSGSTPARLGIGSTGQVLTVSGGLPAWASAPTPNADWSLLNTGGTALTGAQTITISGISGRDQIMILYFNASSASADSGISVRINGVTTNVYRSFGARIESTSSFNSNFVGDENTSADSKIVISQMSNNSASTCSGFCLISGANTTGLKVFNAAGGVERAGGNNQVSRTVGGVITEANAISSVSLFSTVGNWDGGTVFVYATN